MGLLNTYMENRNTPGTVSNKVKKAKDKIGSAIDKGRDLQKKIHDKKVSVAKKAWNALTTPEKGGKIYGPTGLRYPGTEGPTAKQNKPSANKPAAKKPSTQKPIQRQTLDLKKIESKGPGTLSNEAKNTGLKKVTPKVSVDAKTKSKMAKDISKTDRKLARAQKRYENTKSNKVAAKQRTKAQNLRASLASKQNAYSHIAKKGGKLCKKK